MTREDLNAYQRKWRARNPLLDKENNRRSRLKYRESRNEYSRVYGQQAENKRLRHIQMIHRLYGLTPEVFDELLVQQGGCCAVCEAPLLLANIDHCHSTGRVRGLLCRSCNRGIGLLKDSVDVLQRAIAYLQ